MFFTCTAFCYPSINTFIRTVKYTAVNLSGDVTTSSLQEPRDTECGMHGSPVGQQCTGGTQTLQFQLEWEAVPYFSLFSPYHLRLSICFSSKKQQEVASIITWPFLLTSQKIAKTKEAEITTQLHWMFARLQLSIVLSNTILSTGNFIRITLCNNYCEVIIANSDGGNDATDIGSALQ
jgi:hypothetical protein